MRGLPFVRFVPLAVMLCQASAQAQWLGAVGVKAGVNSSNSAIEQTSFVHAFDTERRTGWQAAVFAEWLELPVASVVTQVEYAQRGFREQQIRTGEASPEPLGTIELKTRLDYVSVPVLLKLRTAKTGTGPYALLGPRFDFRVNREAVLYAEGQPDLETTLANVFNEEVLRAWAWLSMRCPCRCC